MKTRLALLCGLTGVAAACSYNYDYTIRATVTEGLVVPAGVPVVLGGASVREGDGSIFEVSAADALRTAEGVTTFEREDSVCCSAAGDELNIYALVDVNSNSTWDAGEPWGADPDNPVKTDDSGYVAEIVIAEAAR